MPKPSSASAAAARRTTIWTGQSQWCHPPCQTGGRAGKGPRGRPPKGVYRIVGTLRGLCRPWERAVSLECTQIKSSSGGRQLPETAAREGEVPGRDIVAV